MDVGLNVTVIMVLIVAAVNALLQRTDRDALLSSMYWLAAPLGWLGVSRERLALRVALVFETLPAVQESVAAWRERLGFDFLIRTEQGWVVQSRSCSL